MPEPCPLCHFTNTSPFFRDEQRSYLRCPRCKLIFVSRNDLLSKKQEKARYDLHENSPKDEGYREFIRNFMKPFIRHIGPPPLNGLDFGSGPGPVLSKMFEARGYDITLYDPYYAPNPNVLDKKYDFVTCTETFEHFYHPYEEWALLSSLIKPDGWLGIMTQLVEDLQNFPEIHYITDMTHVSFYSRVTFVYLAEKENLNIEFEDDNLIFFQKPRMSK